ncbi:MAG: hypothetical protein U0324_17615 [Polyangiales bacterium]
MTAPAAPATFEVLDPDAEPGDAGVGPWRLEFAPAEAVSFAVGAPEAHAWPRPVVWRVELAGVGAEAVLTAESERAARLDAHLTEATSRARAALAARDAAGAVSFAVGAESSPAVGAAEAQLLAELDAPVSFSVGGDDEPGGVGASLERLLRRATRMALVETRVTGRDVAATEVSLLGDARTVVLPGATPDDARLHRGALEATLRTRRAWARIALQTLQVAALVSTGNAVMALPAAWRFVRSLVREAEAAGA